MINVATVGLNGEVRFMIALEVFVCTVGIVEGANGDCGYLSEVTSHKPQAEAATDSEESIFMPLPMFSCHIYLV